jgi:hypothetical protein
VADTSPHIGDPDVITSVRSRLSGRRVAVCRHSGAWDLFLEPYASAPLRL